jgi:hypothetical protein
LEGTTPNTLVRTRVKEYISTVEEDMMKNKRIFVPGMQILKWHLLLFVLVTSLHWLSVLATFQYPDNRALPFEIFRGFILERIGYTLVWAVLLVAHFGIQELRGFLLQRAYDKQPDPFTQSDKPYPKQLHHKQQSEANEFLLLDEDAPRIEYL